MADSNSNSNAQPTLYLGVEIKPLQSGKFEVVFNGTTKEFGTVEEAHTWIASEKAKELLISEKASATIQPPKISRNSPRRDAKPSVQEPGR